MQNPIQGLFVSPKAKPVLADSTTFSAIEIHESWCHVSCHGNEHWRLVQSGRGPVKAYPLTLTGTDFLLVSSLEGGPVGRDLVFFLWNWKALLLCNTNRSTPVHLLLPAWFHWLIMSPRLKSQCPVHMLSLYSCFVGYFIHCHSTATNVNVWLKNTYKFKCLVEIYIIINIIINMEIYLLEHFCWAIQF